MNAEGISADASGRGKPLEARLPAFDEPCPYLPGRVATLEGFFADRADAGVYRALMDHGFRRSGTLFYRPRCNGCDQCRPLRVLVAAFAPSRSQRRCQSRNRDITVHAGAPEFTAEKHDLYRRYATQKHGAQPEKADDGLAEFLYGKVVDSMEFTFRDSWGTLLAVSICDVFADALSSVYCFYDVQARRRGLGTFTALQEIGYARERGLGYYYLGFLVSDCPSMCYKALYRPHELLDASHGWVAGGLTPRESRPEASAEAARRDSTVGQR